MAGRITLRQSKGETFIRIWQGKRWIGRVYRCADGTYSGRIGGHEVSGQPSADSAFNEVGARYFGHPSYAALRAAQSAVRAQKRRNKAQGEYIAREMMSGNYEPFFDLLSK